MTGKNRLILKVEGSAQNDHHLELSVFAQKVRQFLDLLNSSTRDDGGIRTVFRVVNLSHSSPATIECEAVSQDGLLDIAAFNKINANLNSAMKGEAHSLPNTVLSSMEKLAQCDPKQIMRAEIQMVAEDTRDKQAYKLDDHLREVLSDTRNVEDKVISTIDGNLEQVNIHNNKNTFKIYTLAFSVACKFEDNLLGDVRKALGKLVSVSGQCYYRPDQTFPYKIEVQKMTVLPPSEDLPSLMDIYGIAPEATSGKTSEQFVRALRDKWSKGVR